MKIVKGENSVVTMRLENEGKTLDILMENNVGEITYIGVSVELFNKMVAAAQELENEHGQELSNRIGLGGAY